MQKLDRMFTDANDQGMYLFVNGLVDLVWDRGIPHYERLIEMIGARYAAHYVSFASSMDDPYDPLHEQINAAVQRTAPRHLVTQHPGAATNGPGTVWTAEQYYDTPLVDYVMHATGGERDLELACLQAIDWALCLYKSRAAETRGQWPSVVRRRRWRHSRNNRAARLSELTVWQRRLHPCASVCVMATAVIVWKLPRQLWSVWR
jgi:hypothetical protein